MSSKQNSHFHSSQDSTPNKQNHNPLGQERTTIPEGNDDPTIILKSTKSRQQNSHSPTVRQTAKQEPAIVPEIIEEGTKSKQPNTDSPNIRQVSVVRDDEDTVILKGTKSRQQNPHSPTVKQQRSVVQKNEATQSKHNRQNTPSPTAKPERSVVPEVVREATESKQQIDYSPTVRPERSVVPEVVREANSQQQNSQQQNSQLSTVRQADENPVAHQSSALAIRNANLPTVREDEFLPPINRWTKFGGLFIVAIVALAFPIASIIKYKETVKVPALVRPEGELRLVQAATEGQIVQISVKNNQTVKQGDVIATIDDSRLQTQKSQLQDSVRQSRLKQVQINAQIDTLKSQILAETDRIDKNVAATISERDRIEREYQDKQTISQAQVRETESDVNAAIAGLNATQAKLNRYQSAAQEGAISQDQLQEVLLAEQQQQQAVAAAQAKLAGAQTSLSPSDAEIATAASRIAEAKATGEASLATLNREKQALIQQKIEINQQLGKDTRELKQVNKDLQQTVITATTDGIVSRLNLRNPGQTVRPSEEIAQIAPSNSKLTIKASVPANEIGKLEQGQTAQMRVSACPYSDYGTLKGTVTAIAPDAASPQPDNNASSPNNPSQQTGAAFYEIVIKPNNTVLGEGSNQCPIQAGMEGQADIIAREETVLKFLLRKARLTTNI